MAEPTQSRVFLRSTNGVYLAADTIDAVWVEDGTKYPDYDYKRPPGGTVEYWVRCRTKFDEEHNLTDRGIVEPFAEERLQELLAQIVGSPTTVAPEQRAGLSVPTGERRTEMRRLAELAVSQSKVGPAIKGWVVAWLVALDELETAERLIRRLGFCCYPAHVKTEGRATGWPVDELALLRRILDGGL